jgi:callose synthase
MMLTSLPSFFSLEAVNKNRKIILVALYFLIWGEAANVRFLPECICYIFHNVSQCLIKCWSSLFFFPSKKSTGSSLHFTIEEETSRVV